MLLAAGAQAKPSAPAPQCTGLAFSDSSGDHAVDSGPGDADLVGGFFRTDGDVVTANMVVDDLSGGVPTGLTLISWQMRWTLDDESWMVAASIHDPLGPAPAEQSFEWAATTKAGRRREGATSGSFYPGADGIVQVVVPTAGGPETATLRAPFALTEHAVGGPAPANLALRRTADFAPDRGRGTDYRVNGCAAAPPAPGAQTPSAPSPSTPSAPGPSSSPSTPPTADRGPNVLPVRATGRFSARKLRRRSVVVVALESSARVTDLRARLHVRGPSGLRVAQGSLESIEKTARMRMRLSRRLRPGRHALVLTGVVEGRRLARTIFLTVRR